MRLIDTDWLLNALTVYGSSYDYVSVGRVMEMVNNAPTIEAEPVRRGRWIAKRGRWRCSACGKEVFMDSPYCPNCGARMDGGE